MSDIKIETKQLNLYYGENHALKNINIDISKNAITALIGPSGCGKSTYLKTLNRMNDFVNGVKITGEIVLDGENIYAPVWTPHFCGKRLHGLQQPNPFPMSIYDNIAYGPRIYGIRSKAELDRIVEESLISAAIFDEVKDRLKKAHWGFPADSSSGFVSPGVGRRAGGAFNG